MRHLWSLTSTNWRAAHPPHVISPSLLSGGVRPSLIFVFFPAFILSVFVLHFLCDFIFSTVFCLCSSHLFFSFFFDIFISYVAVIFFCLVFHVIPLLLYIYRRIFHFRLPHLVFIFCRFCFLLFSSLISHLYFKSLYVSFVVCFTSFPISFAAVFVHHLRRIASVRLIFIHSALMNARIL